MLYIDTSVLLVYTLTQAVEKDRFPATEIFFNKIATGLLAGATSFYALQEELSEPVVSQLPAVFLPELFRPVISKVTVWSVGPPGRTSAPPHIAICRYMRPL